jgi:hypothetical protein
MRLVFQCICLDIHITLCHTEYKLATCDATSHLAIPRTDFFSNGTHSVGTEVLSENLRCTHDACIQYRALSLFMSTSPHVYHLYVHILKLCESLCRFQHVYHQVQCLTGWPLHTLRTLVILDHALQHRAANTSWGYLRSTTLEMSPWSV